MNITGYPSGIVHIVADSQRELAETFVRMEEFYESPYDDIRGHHFTHDQYIKRYKADTGKDYFAEWNGFNVPGHVVEEFFKVFTDLTAAEHIVKTAVNGNKRFYLIGTHTGGDDCIEHEKAHAFYYLRPTYKAKVSEAVARFRETHASIAEKLTAWLIERGYCEDVLPDEINAYLATTDAKWWIEHTDEATGHALYQTGEPFRYLYAQELKQDV